MKTRREFLRNSVGVSATFLVPGLNSERALATTDEKTSSASPQYAPLSQSRYARARTKLECFDYRGVRILSGRMREQIDRTYDLYVNMSNDDILKGFRQASGMAAPGKDMGGWAKFDSGVTFGQWLSGMARLSCASNDSTMRNKAITLVEGWAATLGPDGDPKMGTYNFEKMECGLVDMHLYAGYDRAMPLLERITVWANKNFDRARVPGSPTNRDGRNLKLPTEDLWLKAVTNEWYTLSENAYRAYLVNGNPLFLDFANLWLYTSYWNKFENTNRPSGVAYLHSYSHVNAFCGAAMAYGVTGDARYLRILDNAYDWVRETQQYATGGYGPAEMTLPPDGSLGNSLVSRTDSAEIPCGSWAAFKLSKYLIGYTGDARYGDWIERLVYNGIGAALPLRPDGTAFYYGDYRLDMASKHYYCCQWPCCSGTYIQAVADYFNVIYFKDENGLFVNLAIPSEATWVHHGQEIKVRQNTQFPESEESELEVSMAEPTSFALRVRVPSWCSDWSCRINGDRVPVDGKPQGWAVIERTWMPGDKATIRFPMSLYLAPVDVQHLRRAAVKYGPVVLTQNVGLSSPLVLRGDDPWSRLVRESDALHFRVKDEGRPQIFASGTDTFRPYYQVEERMSYRMYFDLDAPPAFF